MSSPSVPCRSRIAERLRTWTGARWGVSIVGSGGGATLAEREAERKGDLEGRARAHPLVQAMLAAFPGARIRDVRQPEPPALPAAEAEATGAEDDDDWDPFDPASEEN